MGAENLEELKALCELSDYRLYFTRTKWTQIMECVAGVLFSTKNTEENTFSKELETKSKKPPPYSEVTLQRQAKNDIEPNTLSQSNTTSRNSPLNLKLNLFKNIGFSSQTPESHATTSRVGPMETDKSFQKFEKVNYTKI